MIHSCIQEQMNRNLLCQQHKDNPINCPDTVIYYYGSDYGLPIRDGGSSYIKIDYCPFCGKKLNNKVKEKNGHTENNI